MKKFMLLYMAPVSAEEQMASGDPEKMKQIMGLWVVWFGKMGSAIVDMGNPTGKAMNVPGGEQSGGPYIGGYSIVQAENMDAAVKMVDGHPFLSDKTGKFSVEVFELMPVPM